MRKVCLGIRSANTALTSCQIWLIVSHPVHQPVEKLNQTTTHGVPSNTKGSNSYDELIRVRQKCRHHLEKYAVLIREWRFHVKPNDSYSSNTILTICSHYISICFLSISFNLTRELSVNRRPGAVNFSVSILSRSKVINNLLKTRFSVKSPNFVEYLLFLYYSCHDPGTAIF